MTTAPTTKHPIAYGQLTENTLCWREHTPNRVCILPEGHETAPDRNDPETPREHAVYAQGFDDAIDILKAAFS